MLFQGVGKGINSLFINLLRAFILETLFAYIFGFILKWGILGIYSGIIIGCLIGGVIGLIGLQYMYIDSKRNVHNPLFHVYFYQSNSNSNSNSNSIYIIKLIIIDLKIMKLHIFSF